MRELTKHATTHELRVLLDMVHESETTTSEQAELLYAIVDELTDRGEIDEITEGEIHSALKKALLKAEQQKNVQCSMAQADPVWMDELRTDMLQDQQRRQKRRKSYTRTALTAASVIIILFLSNAAALASGHDFLGAVAKWTKDAVYFVFGTDSAEKPELEMSIGYYSLMMTLDALGIQVDLPTYLPDGFMFYSIEPDEPDVSSDIIVWFAGGDAYFSISVRQINTENGIRFSESDGEDFTEIYSTKNQRYLITTNINRIKAIWFQGINEIEIQGNITYEQLTQILDSI